MSCVIGKQYVGHKPNVVKSCQPPYITVSRFQKRKTMLYCKSALFHKARPRAFVWITVFPARHLVREHSLVQQPPSWQLTDNSWQPLSWQLTYFLVSRFCVSKPSPEWYQPSILIQPIRVSFCLCLTEQTNSCDIFDISDGSDSRQEQTCLNTLQQFVLALKHYSGFGSHGSFENLCTFFVISCCGNFLTVCVS